MVLLPGSTSSATSRNNRFLIDDMAHPIFSVVIPTRKRADTLLYCLKSCATQLFQNVEFIVSNNASTDDTEAVVSQFDDPRIRMINPGRQLSMRGNWEFALGHVTGRYVIFIGDDDALMPNGLDRLAQIISSSDVQAVKWATPLYVWPKTNNPAAGRITLQLCNGAANVRSAAALNGLKWGYLYYHFLPMIYHGAVSIDVINRIRAKTGEFFRAEIPDVYSGIAVAASTSSYLYIGRPISLSGASPHSTGTSYMHSTSGISDTPISKFHSENTLGPHRDFVSLADTPSSIHACVTDSLLRARDELLRRHFYVPLWYRVFLSIREISANSGNYLNSSNNPIQLYCKNRNQLWLYDLCTKLFAKRAATAAANPEARSDELVINAERFQVQDVYSASLLLDKILGEAGGRPLGSDVTTLSLLWGRLSPKIVKCGVHRLFAPELPS